MIEDGKCGDSGNIDVLVDYHTICIYPSSELGLASLSKELPTHPYGLTSIQYPFDSSTCRIAVDPEPMQDQDYFTGVVAHEIGHGLWLKHSDNQTDMMYKYSGMAGWQGTPSLEDVWAYAQLRHQVHGFDTNAQLK